MEGVSVKFEEIVEHTLKVETIEMEDAEEACGSADKSPPATKKQKRHIRLLFKEEWTHDPELKDWVARDPNDEEGTLCTVCNCKLRVGHKAALMFHKNCSKHIRNLSSLRESQPEDGPRDSPKVEWVSRAEQLLSGFLVEHRIPLSDAEHLVQVMKNVFGDSQIARDMSMDKVKENVHLLKGDLNEEEDSD